MSVMTVCWIAMARWMPSRRWACVISPPITLTSCLMAPPRTDGSFFPVMLS